MPTIESQYRCPLYLRNPHIHTVAGRFSRRITRYPFQRERIVTPDNDFFDVDWYEQQNEALCIILHGLEGSSQAPYVLGMVSILTQANIDACAMNFRGCSGEPNKLLGSYHSGKWDDVFYLLERIKSSNKWRDLYLIGFSVGGNITLKLLGERAEGLQGLIKAAVAISPPCDLQAASIQLAQRRYRPYMQYFLSSLHNKIRAKLPQFPDNLTDTSFHLIKTFKEYDDRYTAPWFGYDSAERYWSAASSLSLLPLIKVPTLILSATDDPFLSESCFPKEAAINNQYITLETPHYGGHVGFLQALGRKESWAEKRAREFLLNK